MNQEALPDDVVLSVRNVSKKFCRNLKRSMWYGIQDLAGNLLGRRAEGGNVKPESEDSSSQSLRSQVSSLVPRLPGRCLLLTEKMKKE